MRVSHPSCCPLSSGKSISLCILITWWCFKSTLYLLEITSERFAESLLHQQHCLCSRSSSEQQLPQWNTLTLLPAGSQLLCIQLQSWHRTHCCTEVAPVESTCCPRCCSLFSSLKCRQFIMSTVRSKILKWCSVPKQRLPTIRQQWWHPVCTEFYSV